MRQPHATTPVRTAGIFAALLLAAPLFSQVMPTPAAAPTTGSVGMTTASAEMTTGTGETTAGARSLTPDEVKRILDQAEGASSRTISLEGLRTTARAKRACRHHIFVVDRNGKVLGRRSMPDAWTGSVDIALGKARTAVFFSSDENALSTRQVGELSQPHGPTGTGGAGPLWGIGDTNRGGGQSPPEVERNGVVTFPGGLPLYKNGHLAGGIGVSGDGVDQDESVAFGGAQGFLPGPEVGTPTPLRPKPVDWFAPEQ